MRRSDPGFTLLEVMAAVAVVAIVFTTLARVANQGMQSQGISKRRLEASLLADPKAIDRAVLATAMFRKAGLKAEPVFVSSGPGGVDSDIPGLSRFGAIRVCGHWLRNPFLVYGKACRSQCFQGRGEGAQRVLAEEHEPHFL